MSKIFGNPMVGEYLDLDGTPSQVLMRVNQFGAGRVVPCGCLKLINEEVVIPGANQYDSGVIDIRANSRWDIMLSMLVLGASAGSVIGWSITYYPLIDNINIFEHIVFSNTIDPGEQFTRYGINMALRTSTPVQEGDLRPFMFEGLRLVVLSGLVEPEITTIIHPVLALTPRL